MYSIWDDSTRPSVLGSTAWWLQVGLRTFFGGKGQSIESFKKYIQLSLQIVGPESWTDKEMLFWIFFSLSYYYIKKMTTILSFLTLSLSQYVQNSLDPLFQPLHAMMAHWTLTVHDVLAHHKGSVKVKLILLIYKIDKKFLCLIIWRPNLIYR